MSAPSVLPSLSTRYLGRHAQVFDVVESTNDVVWSWSDAGAAHGVVCVARRQQRGRGRQGRGWLSPAGGLYASILLRPGSQLLALPALSLVTALVVAECLSRDFGLHPRVKWPNDIMLEQGKLAGILLESRQRPEWAVVLGLGLNLRRFLPGDAPAAAELDATSLEEAGVRTQPDVLLACVLNRLEPAYEEFCMRGFPPFQERWARHCLLTGRTVRVILGSEEKEVEVMGVDRAGRLSVRDAEGRRQALFAGEVHLGMKA